jgi:hypothetical protein
MELNYLNKDLTLNEDEHFTTIEKKNPHEDYAGRLGKR